MKQGFRGVVCLRVGISAAALAVVAAAAVAPAQAAFVIDSLDGDITANEINNFKSTAATLTPPTSNWGNAMATHGTPPEGLRMMYEATHDITVLNHYIRFMDVAVAYRNDQPRGEHRVMWEGTVAPVWTNKFPTDPAPGYAGCETGMVAGNIAAAAMLILQNPAIWNTTVPDGNPYGLGTTYKARAQAYLASADAVANNYISKWFVDANTHRVKKPSDPRWAANAENQSVTAWNRQWMFIEPYLYSARAHDALGDNPSYLATYKANVNAFATWFFASAVYYSSGGHNVAKWYYEVPTNTSIENIGHAQHDVFGLFQAFRSGYATGVTTTQMKVLADTTQYVINKGATNAWADNVEGGGTIQASIKTDFIFQAIWNRALYKMIGQSSIDDGALAGSEGCKSSAYILWVKHTFNTSATPTARATARPRATATATARARATATAGGTWQAGVSYSVGAVVTYNGLTYKCLQAHTSQVGWEPPNTPALWAKQ